MPSRPPFPAETTAHRLRFWKTTLCRYHSATGRCRLSASACPFAHGAAELRQAPDLRKTMLCRAWIRGHCTESSANCNYAHGQHDLRNAPSNDGSSEALTRALTAVLSLAVHRYLVDENGENASTDTSRSSADALADEALVHLLLRAVPSHYDD